MIVSASPSPGCRKARREIVRPEVKAGQTAATRSRVVCTWCSGDHGGMVGVGATPGAILGQREGLLRRGGCYFGPGAVATEGRWLLRGGEGVVT